MTIHTNDDILRLLDHLDHSIADELEPNVLAYTLG
jgi:hypothetical protein